MRAATEFCPAELVGTVERSSPPAAAIYHYHLRALGPRVVEGTVIADTDAGWFTWTQASVQLARTTYTIASRNESIRFVVAESPDLSAEFPQPVRVNHAWIAVATSHGDVYFNWDAHGKVVCDPPDFAFLLDQATTEMKLTPQRDDPTPGAAPPTATATASVSPFPNAACSHPFVPASVTEAVKASFPPSVANEGFGAPAVSEIYVAVDPHGKVADAWIFASSGYPELDAEALRAAEHSKYAAPVSYCRVVSGTYLFRADFLPW